MRRLGILLTVLAMLAGLAAACGASAPVSGTGLQAPPPVDTAVPETVALPQPAAGWQDSYLSFMQGSYDIFAALWPDGIGGVGFADLDLDGTPEMMVFDQGASAAMGVHIFDLIGGQVYCVSSTLDSAGGAFDGTHLSSVHVCTNQFESFRLSKTANGWCFWVDSSNGTDQTAWDELIRFGCVDGVLTPVSVCYRYLEFDPASGLVTTEQYTVGGAAADSGAYQAAADVFQLGQDTGYNAQGVFLWNDFERYGASYDGFVNMVKDALAVYSPITDTVTLASNAG